MRIDPPAHGLARDAPPAGGGVCEIPPGATPAFFTPRAIAGGRVPLSSLGGGDNGGSRWSDEKVRGRCNEATP